MIRFFTQRWVLIFIAIITLSLLIWFVGPLIAIADYKPLEKDWVRVLVIFVLLSMWGLNNLRTQAADRKADKKLNEQLLANASKKSKVTSALGREAAAEESILSKRLKEALKTLQGARFKKGQKLYQLPWYVIIGAPGSGKTTALKNSDLNFPLQSQLGDEPVKGAGGTRYCDWWFTDQAVLIDTAGRYTTQDNPKKTDGQTWLGFLSLLKKTRPKRPLNGIIVTVSILDVLKKTPTQQALQATTIKKRIQELNDHLGMSLPVYFVFSKVDLIAGFNTFFSDLEPEEREQMWGFSFTRSKSDKNGGVLDQYNNQFKALITRASERVLNRLNAERDPQRRALIYDFPQQMWGVGDKIHNFLKDIFIPNQYESPAMLRGVYFVSSTQSATPANWVNGVIPPEYCSLPPVSMVDTQPKSFFINRLFKDMIFAEANLASINSKVDRRFRWTYRLITLLVSMMFGSAVFAWYVSYENNTSYIASVYKHIEGYKKLTQGGLNKKRDWDMLAAGLDKLRTMPTGFDKGAEDYPVDMGFGLYQGYKVGAQAKVTYVKALQQFYMPAIARLLARQIDYAGENDEYLYEALRFYLMLFNPDKMDKTNFSLWVNTLLKKKLSGEQNKLLRDTLNKHLQTALTEQVAPPVVDLIRVKKAREILIRTPLDVRLYRRIKNDFMQDNPGQFSVTGVLGKKAEMLFYRRSGKPLSEGIPVLFTYKGFHTGFNRQNKKLSKRLTDERWIYGDTIKNNLDKTSIVAISKRVEEYYFNEYINRWNALMNDLVLKSFSTANQGRMVLRLLASVDAPLIDLLKGIRKNTALNEIPGSSKALKHVGGALVQENAKMSNEKRRLERLVPAGKKNGGMKLPGSQVANAFQEFNDYVNTGKGLPLSQLQKTLISLNKYFKNLAFANDFKKAAFEASRSSDQAGGSIKPVLLAVSEAPANIQGWFRSLAGDSRRVTAVATSRYINNVWKSEVTAFFNKAIKGRYPLVTDSKRDIKLDDFVAFFGPSGILDAYFTRYVKQYVDTTGDHWQLKRAGVSQKTLRLFERAYRIQQAYFAGSGKSLGVQFILKPYALDKVATQSLLDVMGVQVKYKHGPVRAYKVNWPAKDKQESRYILTLASRGTPLSTRVEGEWSIFRMLDKLSTQEKLPNGDDLLLTFEFNGIQSQYILSPKRTSNPFNHNDITGFTLPRRL